MSKYKIAPYFWISNLDNNLYILNKGSRQKIIDKKTYLNILKIIELFKKPHSINQAKKIFKKSENNEELLNTLQYVISQNILIDNRYSHDHPYSRNHLFFNYKYGEFFNIDKKLKTKTILILGCGGIGNFVTYFLVSIGIKNFVLIDGDKIEESNLNRQFLFKKEDIGFFKVDILKREILKINSQINAETHQVYINDFNQLETMIKTKIDLIIVSADEKMVLKNTINYSVKNNIPLLNVGYLNDISTIGPFFIPNKTACPFCGLAIVKNEIQNLNINKTFSKAPSIFTNNSLSASLASAEILNYFLCPSKMLSINQRVGINCMTFEKFFLKMNRNPNCLDCHNNV